MDMKTVKPTKSDASSSAVKRQMIASGVALAIMALGAWSLLGQKSPYHPEIYGDDVTRSGTPALIVSPDKP